MGVAVAVAVTPGGMIGVAVGGTLDGTIGVSVGGSAGAGIGGSGLMGVQVGDGWRDDGSVDGRVDGGVDGGSVDDGRAADVAAWAGRVMAVGVCEGIGVELAGSTAVQATLDKTATRATRPKMRTCKFREATMGLWR